MRRIIFWILGLTVLIGVTLVIRLGGQAGAIGAGYAAKQICSGVLWRDCQSDLLSRRTCYHASPPSDPSRSYSTTNSIPVSNKLWQKCWAKVTAQHRPRYGCTLGEAEHAPLFPFVSLIDNALLGPDGIDEAPATITTPALTLGVGNELTLQSALDAAFAEPPEGGRNTLAVIVMHRGQIVAERYGAPVTAKTPMQGWSMNKSLMATFIGRQVDNGDLDLTAPVLTALRDAGADGKALEKVDPSLTLQHLLSMSTGFAFSERYLPGDDVTDSSIASEDVALSTGYGHAFAGEQWPCSSNDINGILIWQQSLQGEYLTGFTLSSKRWH